MLARRFVIAAAAVLCGTGVTAQTQGQLLERGIFEEETAGDLDAAIRIYERLVSTPAVPAEIAALAQNRLSDGRRRKEATLRAMALAAEQSRTPTGLPGRVDPPPEAPGAKPAQTPPVTDRVNWSEFYESGSALSVTGNVTAVEWANPLVVVYVKDADGNRWGFTIDSPDRMIERGMDRNSLKLGDQLLIQGSLARDEGASCPGPLPNACATLRNGARHAWARMITRLDGQGNVDGDAASSGAGRRGRGAGAQ